MCGPVLNAATEATSMIRPRPRSTMPGSKSRVSSLSATMLTCNISAMRAGSERSKRPAAPSPALLISTSIARPRLAMSCARRPAAPGLARSAATTVVAALSSRKSAARTSIGARLRAASTRSWPCRASSRASAAPMPPDAPVTRARGRAALSIRSPGRSGAQPHRRYLARHEEVAAGGRPDLVDRDAGGDLAQCHALRGDREQAEIGDDEVDDALRRHRDRAALDEARRAAARRLLHRDEDVFGAGRQIHRPADAAALLAGHLPVGEIAVGGDLVGAEHGDVDAPRANEAERIGVMHDRGARPERHMLPAGVDEVQILLAGAGQGAVADDPVFGMEDDLPVAEIIIRAQRRDADPEIDDPAVLEFHRQPIAHLLPAQPLRVAHAAFLHTRSLTQRTQWIRDGREDSQSIDQPHDPV